MTQADKIAVVFGGSGFVGRQIVRELAAKGLIVKVASRVPERANFLKPCGNIGQVVPVLCDYSDSHSVAQVVRGANCVVNCVGILFEKGRKNKFQKVHTDFPALIAKSCADENVSRFVHLSALSCEKGTSKYAKSKYEGEKAVLSNFPNATILRPSVIFGPDDSFFNMFAEMARYTPILPLIGGGKTLFQPVYVGDVADAVLESLFPSADHNAQGRVYQLGGPDVISFKDVYKKIFEYTGRKRCLISAPFGIMKLQAVFLSLLPKPPLTPDQVESLKTDNIVEDGALGLRHLNINPQSLDLILPSYLELYKSGGCFGDVKAA